MLPEERDLERMTDAQISDLLTMALTSDHGVELERLMALPSQQLVLEVRPLLERNGVGLREASLLMAVNDLTLKSWLETAKELPESAHQKLAAMGMLLHVAAIAERDQAIAVLVKTATSLAKGVSNQAIPGDERVQSLSSTFGPSGLMAAAMYIALE